MWTKLRCWSKFEWIPSCVQYSTRSFRSSAVKQHVQQRSRSLSSELEGRYTLLESHLRMELDSPSVLSLSHKQTSAAASKSRAKSRACPGDHRLGHLKALMLATRLGVSCILSATMYRRDWACCSPVYAARQAYLSMPPPASAAENGTQC